MNLPRRLRWDGTRLRVPGQPLWLEPLSEPARAAARSGQLVVRGQYLLDVGPGGVWIERAQRSGLDARLLTLEEYAGVMELSAAGGPGFPAMCTRPCVDGIEAIRALLADLERLVPGARWSWDADPRLDAETGVTPADETDMATLESRALALQSVLATIIAHPHTRLDRQVQWVPAWRARFVSSRRAVLIAEQPERSLFAPRHPLPRELPEERRVVTADTPENRSVAALIEDVDRTLTELLRDPGAERHAQLTRLLEFVRRARTMGFLAEVAPDRLPGEIRDGAVLTPRYRSVHELWRALRSALPGLGGGPPDLASPMRGLEFVYAQWVSLSLTERLARQTGQLVDSRALAAKLWERRDGTPGDAPIRLRGPKGEARVWLKPLVPFRDGSGSSLDGLCSLTADCRPDLLVRSTPVGKGPRTLAAHVTFRVGPGGAPPEEALDVAARYREAIQAPPGSAPHEVLRAVAFYPGRTAPGPSRRSLPHGVEAVPAFPGFVAFAVEEADRAMASHV